MPSRKEKTAVKSWQITGKSDSAAKPVLFKRNLNLYSLKQKLIVPWPFHQLL